jgi:hypothetical protein
MASFTFVWALWTRDGRSGLCLYAARALDRPLQFDLGSLLGCCSLCCAGACPRTMYPNDPAMDPATNNAYGPGAPVPVVGAVYLAHNLPTVAVPTQPAGPMGQMAPVVVVVPSTAPPPEGAARAPLLTGGAQ